MINKLDNSEVKERKKRFQYFAYVKFLFERGFCY